MANFSATAEACINTRQKAHTHTHTHYANTPTPTRKPLRMAGSRRAVDVKTPRQANIEVMKNMQVMSMQVMEARRLSASHRSRELRG